MDDQYSNNPFNELPESLVEEMLSKCDELGSHLNISFQNLYQNKDFFHSELVRLGILSRDSDLISPNNFPTTCGIDGSYTIEKMLSTDMVAVAAVAVEGLIPPKEEGKWPNPRHRSMIESISHSEANTVVSRAIMMCMELELATEAPHAVVFIDNSLTTPLIYFNFAINNRKKVSTKLSEAFNNRIKSGLTSYLEILESKRTDKIYVGVPKYTTNKEITKGLLKTKEDYEDRGFLSFILKSNEYVGPIDIQEPTSEWHLPNIPGLEEIIEDIISALHRLSVIYYRPNSYFPALRLETSRSLASNKQRLAILLEALSQQCKAPGIMEPYPLYMADRMVKHLGTALPAIRKTTTQEMVMKWDGAQEDIFLAMHGYRTDMGR
jgi:hypothetical protein